MPDLPKSIAISWYFAHHAEHNGYKQILKYTDPLAVLGIDERLPDTADSWARRYPWIYEVKAYRQHCRTPCQVLHLLYGETYFRLSPWLFGNVPIVATFHQPPKLLKRRLLKGDETGRVSSQVHRITRSRFKKLDAAIVISEGQREVLAEFVDPDKIHLIPLGASTAWLIDAELKLRGKIDVDCVLTVGNWLRDWDFYFDFIDHCRTAHPEWRFLLVNRNLPEAWRNRAKNSDNLSWQRDIDDESLLRAYATSGCLFLPLLEATGNNTVNEALGMGCPIICNVSLGISNQDSLVTSSDRSFDSFADGIEKLLSLSSVSRAEYRGRSQDALRELDWSETAYKTLGVYKSVL